MKSADARKVYLTILVLAIAANVALVAFFWHNNFQRAQISESQRVKKLLNRLHSSFSFETIFLGRFKELFRESAARKKEDLQGVVSAWFQQNGLASGACEIIFFKGHEPLNAPVDERDDWAFFFSRIDCGQFRKFRTEGEDKNRIVRFLKGGIGFERLEGKPGQLRRISINDWRSFGVWFSDPGRANSDADGMLALTHKSYISRRLLARALFERLKVDGNSLGHLNLFRPEDSLTLPGLDPHSFAATVKSSEASNGLLRLNLDGKMLSLLLRPDGQVFYAIERQLPVPLPFWGWALAFFWFPIWLNSFVRAGSVFRLSLPVLLVFVVAISMALPAAAIAFYWNAFIDSRRESLKISASDRLQQHLIQLDASFQQTFRTRRLEYQYLTSLFDGRPENLQRFIDHSVQLELEGKFDSCMLLNAEGKFVRPTAGSCNPVRRLVFYDRAYREKVLEQYFAWGWVPFDLEASYALETPAKNINITDFVSLMPSQGKTAYSSFAAFTAKDIIKLHNSRFDGNTAALKDGVTSMVMSSFIGNDDENPVARISQSLGDYFDFGFGLNQSINYVDLIKDSTGRANHCLIIFSGQHNYTARYFDKVFSDQNRWPGGVKFFAITERLFNINYPWLDLWKRTGNLLALLQPPRNTHVEEIMINNEPHLLCAYVARRCHGYVLAAALPLKEIEQQLVPLRQQMLFAALLFAATFAFVVFRLNFGIILPARKLMQGVRALESRDHSHQIIIDTNDEWQQLAETFNSSLESMKELEVAHFVQTCILPAADIRSGAAVFAGRTVPADDVGGDYYDAFVTGPGAMTFVMGDVSGHSVSAALVVSMARAGFAGLIDGGMIMPHDLFARFNQLMLEHLRRAKMMTCFAGHLDADGRLTCSNAGQAFPLLIRADGSVEFLRFIGYPLGVARRRLFKAETMLLPDECRLVMFSDGVVEAMNEQGEPFGYERLEKLVQSLGCHCSREDFFAGLYGAIKKFAGSVPWNDDVTVALLDYSRNEAKSVCIEPGKA